MHQKSQREMWCGAAWGMLHLVGWGYTGFPNATKLVNPRNQTQKIIFADTPQGKHNKIISRVVMLLSSSLNFWFLFILLTYIIAIWTFTLGVRIT